MMTNNEIISLYVNGWQLFYVKDLEGQQLMLN